MPVLITPSPIGAFAIHSDGASIVRLAWLDPRRPPPTADPDPVCHRAAAELQAYFSGALTEFSVPVSLLGSDLQLGVWNQMLGVPYGAVATYGDVADAIGAEPQAVGVACGQNPIPVIVPCHRIVGAGGKLVGYSGGRGIETKAFLLDHESGQGRLL